MTDAHARAAPTLEQEMAADIMPRVGHDFGGMESLTPMEKGAVAAATVQGKDPRAALAKIRGQSPPPETRATRRPDADAGRRDHFGEMAEMSAEDFEQLRAKLRAAPTSGGVALDDPGDGMMSKRQAQALFVDGMAVVMVEWHGRGMCEGRLRERERIATILRHRAALGRRDLAEPLAFTTDKAVDDVVRELEAAPRDPE